MGGGRDEGVAGGSKVGGEEKRLVQRHVWTWGVGLVMGGGVGGVSGDVCVSEVGEGDRGRRVWREWGGRKVTNGGGVQ